MCRRARLQCGAPQADGRRDGRSSSWTELEEESCEISDVVELITSIAGQCRATAAGRYPLRWVYLHVLRELAQHDADILREQLEAPPD